MKFIACDAMVSYPRIITDTIRRGPGDLLEDMDRLNIDSALVRHHDALNAGPLVGNAKLQEDLKGFDRLYPVWFITPDGSEPDYKLEKEFSNMFSAGAKFCWMDPIAEHFSIQPWCCGELYEELCKYKVPLLLDFKSIEMNDLATALKDFPKLKIILLNSPRLGRNRMLYPLLKQYKSLYLCLGFAYSVHKGYEDLCRNFGHERFVFGSAFPEVEGGAAVTGLMYSGISDEAKKAIAYDNLLAMMEEVKC
jgi:Amidohydrolase